MRNKIDYFYSVVLIFLMILSVYQTGRLWFDDLSSYNPFSSLTNDNVSLIPLDDSYKSTNYNMTKPQDIMIYLSKEELFAKLSNNQSDSKKIYDQSLIILNEFMKNNESVTIEELNYNSFWDKVQGSIILTYDYILTNEIFNYEIENKNNMNVDNIGGINLIVIDIINSNSKANIYLANTIKEKMIKITKEVDSFEKLYTINNDEGEKQNLYDFIDTNTKIEFNYISSKNKDQFSGIIFLREQSKEFLIFDEVGINKTFISDGIIDSIEYDSYVRKYFNNPNIVQMAEQGEGENYYYWDNKMSINYNKNGILEYTQPHNSSTNIVSVNKAYYIASTFIDKYLIKWEEIYLADYKIDKTNNLIEFYFNYRLHDYPLFIEELEDLGMNYPVEITVSGDNVTNAKMMLLEQNLKIMPERTSISDNYIRVLDQVYTGNPIKNIFIGYKLSQGKSTAELKWVVEEKQISFYDVLLD